MTMVAGPYSFVICGVLGYRMILEDRTPLALTKQASARFSCSLKVLSPLVASSAKRVPKVPYHFCCTWLCNRSELFVCTGQKNLVFTPLPINSNKLGVLVRTTYPSLVRGWLSSPPLRSSFS